VIDDSAPTSAALVAAAAAGDLSSQERLFLAYAGLARATARRLLPSDASVDDVVQEAFIEAFSNLASLREPRAFAAFLRLNVRKHADRITRRKLQRWSPFTAGTAELDPQVVVEERAVAEVVRDALRQANDSDRLLLGLRYYAGWTEPELARAFLTSPSAIKKRLHDARRRLRPALHELRPIPEESSMTVPTLDPSPLLGRRISPTGDPRDGGRPVRIPAAGISSVSPQPASELLLTGIKVIDVFCPLMRGGTVELLGPEGCGQLVLAAELTDRLTARGTVVLAVGRDTHPYGNSTFGEWTRDVDVQNPIWVLAEDDDTDWQHALRTARSLAAAIVNSGTDVLLVVDAKDVPSHTPALEQMRAEAGVTRTGAITVLIITPDTGHEQLTDPDASYDTSLVFSRTMMARGWYPAIHPLASRARWHEQERGDEHHQLAATEAALVIDRAERVRLYLTQPFNVAVDFTGKPGQYVELIAALADIDSILADATSATPASELAYRGALEPT
jgi:RNA polymerase sigma factor (sigma-70 family)